MKNKKRFSRWMLSAAALLMVMPLANQSQNVHASEFTRGHPGRPGMVTTYGIAPYATPKKPKKGGTSKNAIGIDLHRKYSGVEGTQNANYVHDHIQTGYLVAAKKIKGEPFGPTKHKFKTSVEGSGKHTWVVYMKPNPAEAGKVGMLYKKALTYYPSSKNKSNKSKKSKEKVTLDARLIWNGTWRPDGDGKNNNLQFSSENISIKEPYQGVANFTLKLYDNKTGKPFKKIRTQIMQTDIDYKQGLIFNTPSYLIYDTKTKLNKGYLDGWNTNVSGKATVFGDYGTKHGHQGTVYPGQKEGQITYIPKKPTNSFNVTFVHSYRTVPYRYQDRAKFAKPASDSSLHSTYKISSLKKLPSSYDDSKLYVNAHYTKGKSTDYFGFSFDKGSNSPYPLTVDKLVGTKDKDFKRTKNAKKAISVKNDQPIYFDLHTQLKEPSSVYVPKNNTNSNYVALPIKEALTDKYDPNLGKPGLEKGTKSQQGLVLRDYVDSKLDVDRSKTKIYYAKTWNDTTLKGKKASASKYFYGPYIATVKKGPNKGKTVVEAVMKPNAMKLSSDAWMKDYHLIIKTKLKKNIQPTNGTLANGWTLIDNKGYLDTTPSDPDSWVKIIHGSGSESDKEWQKEYGNPTTDSTKKVYAANLTDPNKVGKVLSYGTSDTNAKAMGALVYPDQYLYYRLKFKIRPMKAYQKTVAKDGKIELDQDVSPASDSPYRDKKAGKKGDPLIEDTFKKLTVTDDLSDRFANKSESDKLRDIDNVQVEMDDESALNTPKENHSYKLVGGNQLKVNITDSKILDALSKSDKNHYIYVQYRVHIRPNDLNGHKAKQDLNLDPTDDQYNDNHKVQNQAQIDGTFDEHQRTVETRDYTAWDGTYYEDSDGHKHKNYGNFTTHYLGEWATTTTKHLSDIKKLTNKTTTNKTINWINVVDNGPFTKVPISWANTNDVINSTDKVWKVQSTIPTMRQEGRLLKHLILKDTVKSNEKLDAKQEWSADNSEDSDLATGTYTGPQVFRNGENVTKNFDITSSSTTVIAKAKESYLKDLADKDPDTPNQFTLAVPGTIVENRKLNQSGTFDALTGAQDEAVTEIQKQNDTEGDRPIAKADWEGEPDTDGNDSETTIQKSVKAVKDLTTGENVNVTGDGQYMNPKHKYEITYQLDAQLGTDRDNRNLKISDALPENSSLVAGSLSVPSGFTTSGTTSTDIHIAYNGNANVLAAKGTIDNPTVETMTYKVKVNANSDWSDYYNSETRSGYGQQRDLYEIQKMFRLKSLILLKILRIS